LFVCFGLTKKYERYTNQWSTQVKQEVDVLFVSKLYNLLDNDFNLDVLQPDGSRQNKRKRSLTQPVVRQSSHR